MHRWSPTGALAAGIAAEPGPRVGPGSARTGARAVVHLDRSGADTGFAEFRSAVEDAMRLGARTVVVDASELDRLSSPAVTALLWAQAGCRARGGVVVLRGLSRRGRRMLRRSGLTGIFDIDPGIPGKDGARR